MKDTLEKKIKLLSQFITKERLQRFQKALEKRTKKIILAIDNVYHEHNASALLRTAEGIGLQEVWIIEDRNPFNPTKGIVLGVTNWLTLRKFSSPQELLQETHQRGYQLVVTVMPETEGSVPLSHFEPTKPLVLVVGAEKEGVTEYLIKKADQKITIPMKGLVESFNVSVATGILLYELRQKIEKNMEWSLSEKEKKEILYQWLKKTVKKASEIEKRGLEEPL